MKKIFTLIRLSVILVSIAFILCGFIEQPDVEVIRKRPEKTYKVYKKYKSYMHELFYPFSEDLTNEELFFIFCCQTAYQMAPFGPSHSITLKDMLESKKLNCGNYGFLAVRLAQSCVPDILDRNQIHFIGWDRGAVGNHQTLELNNYLFIDLTNSLYAFISFDSLIAGEKLPECYNFNFSTRRELDWAHALVLSALKNGLFQKEHIIYHWESINEVLTEF